jgi:hypothetical protein
LTGYGLGRISQLIVDLAANNEPANELLTNVWCTKCVQLSAFGLTARDQGTDAYDFVQAGVWEIPAQ